MKDYITLAVATLGAVLGIINTWSGLNQRRVKLKVIPKTTRPLGGGAILNATHPSAGELDGTTGCIEVTNLSAFPVTIKEIGFTINGDPRKNPHAAIVLPLIHDGGRWPRRLESRTSVSLYFQWDRQKKDINKAYALTDCGEVAYGNSPALKAMKKLLFK